MAGRTETRYAGSDVAFGLVNPDGKLWPMAAAEADGIWALIAMGVGKTEQEVRSLMEAEGYRVVEVNISIKDATP